MDPELKLLLYVVAAAAVYLGMIAVFAVWLDWFISGRAERERRRRLLRDRRWLD